MVEWIEIVPKKDDISVEIVSTLVVEWIEILKFLIKR